MGPPKIRVIASLAANAAANSAATAAACPCPFRTASVSQLPAEPSPSSTPSMTTPMSSSRQSSQPRSHWRSLRSPVLLRLPGRRTAPARDPRRHREGGGRDEDGFGDDLRRGRDAQGRAGRADPRSDGHPDGPGGVHHRHEGAPRGPLDGGALHVDQHVENTDAQPDDHEGHREQRNPARDERKAHDRHRGGDEQQRARDGPAAAQPVQDRGRREQPENGPDGHSRQEQPDRGRADAQARLDGRQPRTPRRDGDPAQPERGRDRPPPAGQRRALWRDNGIRHRSASPKNLTVEDIMGRS